MLQADIDGRKTPSGRNRLGQFATPTTLARDILEFAHTLLPSEEAVRFLDPAIGTGSFYSALGANFPPFRIAEALGFEVDSDYAEPAAGLWGKTGLTLKTADFTKEKPSNRYNLVICNPPYVRHHHLKNGEKERLRHQARKASGIYLGGLAGLYCHFLGIAHAWMAPGGLAGWLIPSEFMDVNYGQAVKRYLLDQVTLIRIHRFDPGDLQFADALVSSAVVWFKNAPPPPNAPVDFTYGGSLLQPKMSRTITADVLRHEAKWTRFPSSDSRLTSDSPILSDFF